MLRASWCVKKALEVMKEMHAVVVACPACNREDSICSDDREWRCPDCKKTWKVSDLARRKP